MNNQTDVLIIGGGFAGVNVAHKLSKGGLSVTLIDRKNYFEVTFAMLRNVADPKLLGDTPRKLYSDFIDGTFIQGNIISMNASEVTLENGKSISFKRAIIASGSRYESLPLAKSMTAFDYAERHQEIEENHKLLVSAKSVLLIGGGNVGVEFAGEIASAFPDKIITLAHSTSTLLDSMKPKAQQKALEQLTAKGVKVIFNRRFKKDGDSYKCSLSNDTIQADLVYECVGMKPNTEFLKNELANVLDKKGLVKVDEFMNVVGYKSLYALGDCSALDTLKHGYLSSVQGGMLAKSILTADKGKKVKAYSTPPVVVITVTGRDTGVAQFPFGVFTAKFLINLKQKDMGINNMYKMFGSLPNKLS
ncbi:MAG: FAD-dependent oxidoreductase [Saccharospirillaceae bacterium]|nr:FAD-dependent oxidoreductase [Pseudomonadales bacterium]NRB77471.1 FAD-dependent oxidoreductase [Saccharospirillaceae bacterium]